MDKTIEIVESSRGWIRISVGTRTTRISGEGMAPGNDVHFYADIVSIRSWDDGEPILETDRNYIINHLPTVAGRDGFILKFE